MRWQDRGLVDGGEALRLSLWEMEIVEREDVYACIQANEHIKRVTLPHCWGSSWNLTPQICSCPFHTVVWYSLEYSYNNQNNKH